jgi:hypothetical protein
VDAGLARAVEVDAVEGADGDGEDELREMQEPPMAMLAVRVKVCGVGGSSGSELICGTVRRPKRRIYVGCLARRIDPGVLGCWIGGRCARELRRSWRRKKPVEDAVVLRQERW